LLSRKPGDSAGDNASIRRRIVSMQETLEAALASDQDNLF
jgi:hypothetical protein